MNTKRLNLINYVGGKNFMLKEILSLLDYSKTCYIELFGGSAKVLLNKKPHKIEIYNDIDNELFNLFSVVRDNYEEFVKELEMIPYMEAMFYKIKDEEPKDKIKRAVRTYVLFNMSFASKGSTFGYSYTRNMGMRFLNRLKLLKIISDRVQNVQILNRDYKTILKNIRDKEDIMLYADPPYYGAEYYYKNGNFGKEDHETLAKYLNEAKYSFMLSYYYFDGIEDLYPKHKFNYYEFKKTKASYGITTNNRNKTKPITTELLITNYKPEKLLIEL